MVARDDYVVLLGELWITPDDGVALIQGPSRTGGIPGPGPDFEPDEREIPSNEAALRAAVRTDERGRYRPLAGAKTLPGAWRLHCRPGFELVDAIEVIYPLATVHRRQLEQGTLEIVGLDAVLERQSGRYRVAASLSNEGRDAASDVLCGICVKQPLWRGDVASDGQIPCPEPCSVLVSLCREAALWEKDAPAPSEVDPLTGFAAFDEPGNEVREAYLRARPQLPRKVG